MLKSSAPMPQPSAAIMVLISSLPASCRSGPFRRSESCLERQDGLKRRSRPCLADHRPTRPRRCTTHSRRVALLAVSQLSRQRAAVEGALTAHQVTCLSSGLTGPGGVESPCPTMRRARTGFLEVRAQFVVEDGLDDALDLGITELGLRLPLELRCGILTLMTAVSPSRMSSPETLSFRSFARLFFRRIRVDRTRQRRPEP